MTDQHQTPPTKRPPSSLAVRIAARHNDEVAKRQELGTDATDIRRAKWRDKFRKRTHDTTPLLDRVDAMRSNNALPFDPRFDDDDAPGKGWGR